MSVKGTHCSPQFENLIYILYYGQLSPVQRTLHHLRSLSNSCSPIPLRLCNVFLFVLATVLPISMLLVPQHPHMNSTTYFDTMVMPRVSSSTPAL